MVTSRILGAEMTLLLSLRFLINKTIGIIKVGCCSISINELGGKIE